MTIGHARYAPCEIEDLKARGYDYWALGHVHAFERVCDDPAVMFPGNVQGRNIRETGTKGAVLVEVQDRSITRIDRVDFDVLRWARIVVDCAGCETVEAVQDQVGAGLTTIRAAEEAGRGLVVRVVLEGETVLADILADRHSALRDEARALAGPIADDLWIEKLSVHARLPVEANAAAHSDDLVAMLSGAEHDPALAAGLTPFMTAVAAALPPEPDLQRCGLRHFVRLWNGGERRMA